MELQLGRRLLEKRVITEEQLSQAERQMLHQGRLRDSLVALGFVSEEEFCNSLRRHPPVPVKVEHTGLDLDFIADLMLKHILFMGEFKLINVADRIKLPISIVDAGMELLRRRKFVEVLGATSYATPTYDFKITEQGKNRAMEVIEICRYAGPAPVTLDAYMGMVERQTVKSMVISEESMKKAFSHLLVDEKLLKRLGPAASSGKALFLYGPSGNGKTAIAEAIGAVLPDCIYVPYAITVGGQIVTVYDPVDHIEVRPEKGGEEVDQRWALVKRPVVVTGGELTLRMLDLGFNPISKSYEASLQMKANNGVFIADDFGRQQVDPRTFLNRWMVPLERGVDFMSLHTGAKFAIPFDVLVIFATNIEPRELMDEAFLRRIRYKVKIEPPTMEEYEAIFRKLCLCNGIDFVKEVFDHLISCYQRSKINFTACHPRDIIEHVLDNARYTREAPQLTKEGIAAAWKNCFIGQ